MEHKMIKTHKADGVRFRVWDTRDKKWAQNVVVDGTGRAFWLSTYSSTSDGLIEIRGSALERYEFLKCTGLTDCKGVEIFEADIMACSTTPNQYVEWEMGRYLLKPDLFAFEKVHMYWEVIGNRFENADLLPQPDGGDG